MQTSDEQQMLQNLAYQAWLERGRPLGSPEVDWERAQQLLQLYRQDIADTAQTQIPELTDVASDKAARKSVRAKPSRPRNAA